MSITHPEMVKTLAKTGEDILAKMTPMGAHLLHMAVGVSGEVGELLGAIEADDRDNALEELGDIEFYFEGLCQGVDMVLVHSVIDLNTLEDDPFVPVLTQAAEMLDVVKKLVVYNDEKKLPQLRIEMQRFRTYLDGFYALAELTREQALEHNINKLGKRYEGFNYSDDAAKARADKV